MKKYVFILILLLSISVVYTQEYLYGYLKVPEVTICMDECANYMIEDEEGDFISYLIPLDTDDSDISFFLDRFVQIVTYDSYQCLMCDASIIADITLSNECDNPVFCFADPCEVASDCQLNDPVECVPNYCGGCYADFYDLNGNIVDCYNSLEPAPCDDIGNAFFGMCDMFLGYAVVNGNCEGISGCSWDSNGTDYLLAFFNTYEECESNCLDEPYLCENIEYDYDQLHSGIYVECEEDDDCVSIWGDCDVGLGGCHYSVNELLYELNEIQDLVDVWVVNDCMEWVCDCFNLPDSLCNNGICELAYCANPNPSGCFSSGCAEGYGCIDYEEAGDCVPSSCFCDEFSGEWYCSEDCNGGSCFQLGDVNFDSNINIVDIVAIVNIVLGLSPYTSLADVNSDSTVNIIDVVILVDFILE